MTVALSTAAALFVFGVLAFLVVDSLDTRNAEYPVTTTIENGVLSVTIDISRCNEEK